MAGQLFAAGLVIAETAPPTKPVPRVAADRHVGFITKIDVTANGHFALTVSDDKTARVWDLRNRRLHETIRVPIAAGHEGRLYAGTINFDGTLAALGGYTGMLGDRGAIIYLYNLRTGNLNTIRDLPVAAVDNLLFSRNGRYLAAAFAGGHGLMVLDLVDQRLVRHMQQGNERILGMDFGPDHSLIVTALDGSVNKYGGEKFELLVNNTLSLDGEPMHVRYSPDNSKLAVGYRAAPMISILDAQTLEQLRTLDASTVDGLVGLIAAEWSSDGSYVFGGGRTLGNIETPLLRWSLFGDAGPQTLLMAPKRIGDIHRLPDGQILYASGMPTIGLVSTDGTQQWHVDAVTADIRSADAAAFRLTADGLAVQFPFDRQGRRIGNFSPVTINPTVSLQVGPAPAERMYPAHDTDPAWDVQLDSEAFTASLNGVNIELDPRESPRTYTLSGKAGRLFLGTAWFLRAYNEAAQLVWRTEVTGKVQLMNTSKDGRWVVAALSDGTIRWFRTKDGAEVLALFPHANGKEWIAWIPDGYYMSSLYGDEYMGWQINRGWMELPDFFKAVQFERVLYRPDVVQAFFQSYGDSASITNLLGADSFSIDQLQNIAPPRIVSSTSIDQSSKSVGLLVSAESTNRDMQEISVYVDGIPIISAAERSVDEGDARLLKRKFSLPVSGGESLVRIEISNSKSIGVNEFFIDNPFPSARRKGDLYLLAVGVSEFNDDDILDLSYAAKDARDIAQAFTDTSKALFDNIHIKVIADGGEVPPTAKQISSGLNFFRRAKAQDTVVLFFASHGLTINSDYYFAPFDAQIDPSEKGRLIDDDFVLDTFVKWEEIFEPMRLAAGKRLMIVDTCASADITGPTDLFSLQKRSASSKIAFLTASAGDQLSQELSGEQQGLFTFTVLTALRTQYDPNEDGVVTLNEVFELSSEMVPNRREDKLLEQTPQLMTPDFLAEMSLATGAIVTNGDGR